MVVARGSEWFYPEGPAPLFSAGTGAAPCSSSPAMAFTFAAFCYMLALLLTAALIFFAIWHVSSWRRGREEEAVAQPLLAPGPRSMWRRLPEVPAPGDGAGAAQAARRRVCALSPPGAASPGGAEACGGGMDPPAVPRHRPRAPLLLPCRVGWRRS